MDHLLTTDLESTCTVLNGIHPSSSLDRTRKFPETMRGQPVSRSARNRSARDNRLVRPVNPNPPAELIRPAHVMPDPIGIRNLGYPGRTAHKVRYSGSESGGYRSAWSASQYYRTSVTVDSRWSNTITDERNAS